MTAATQTQTDAPVKRPGRYVLGHGGPDLLLPDEVNAPEAIAKQNAVCVAAYERQRAATGAAAAAQAEIKRARAVDREGSFAGRQSASRGGWICGGAGRRSD